VLDEKSIDEIADESHEDILEIVEHGKKEEVEMYDRVETIRIVSPGSYELNLEKMAQSDQRIVSVGNEGNYIIDLMSMAKEQPKKKKKQK
jgi:predicted  nucleic acid-binding Zn-ribbon protein